MPEMSDLSYVEKTRMDITNNRVWKRFFPDPPLPDTKGNVVL